MDKDKAKGLFATVMAIGLMASWSALASSNDKGQQAQVRSLEAITYVSEQGTTQAPVRYPGVKVSVKAISPKAFCSSFEKKEYANQADQDKPGYSFQTSGKPGDDYGKVYFQHCERGQYQVSVEVPKGLRLQDPNKQNQVVRLDPKRTTTVDFRMEKQK